MREFDLLDQAVLSAANDIKSGDDCWVSLSNDPFFFLSTEKRTFFGWCNIFLEMEHEQPTVPRFYFDIGHGFNEHHSVPLKHTGGNSYSGLAYLSEEVRQVRFDPIEYPGDFRLNRLAMKKLSKAGMAKFSATRAIELLKENPTKNFGRVMSAGGSLLKKQSFRKISTVPEFETKVSPYPKWIETHDYSAAKHKASTAKRVKALKSPPKISVLMPVFNTSAKHLDAAIKSVVDQIYPNWELCICNDRSSSSHIKPQLDKWAAKDERIKVYHRQINGHISKASNSALTQVKSDWVAMLDHDDLLREHALAEIAFAIDANPNCQLIYSDEDKIDEKGKRFDPHFKADFSPELFRSMNYLNHLTVHRTENIVKVGAWRDEFVGSQDYDLNLRIWERIDDTDIVHIPKILYHWRAIEGSTALEINEKNYAVQAGLKALQAHLKRIGANASAEVIPNLPFFRVVHNVSKPEPKVSLIIPTKDRVDLVAACIESIFKTTNYSNFEIIVVDNNSEEKASFDYFDSLQKSGKAKILKYPHPFNYSAINNFAVAQSESDIVGLVNNDIEFISDGWLTEMVSWAEQPDIGCVGAKLYFESGQIQHGGVVLGIGGVAGHAHKYFDREAYGYFSRAKVTQNFSAVTAACLLVKRDIFNEAEGLNEKDLIVAFNDVDFCLKVRTAGYRNVWTPFAEAYHYESISRGAENDPQKIARFNREIDYMKTTWGKALENDPFYSPNLSNVYEDFSLKI